MRQRQAYSLAGPLVLAGLLLCARIASVPALHDPVAGSAPSSAHLNIPLTYLILAPLFTLWDGVSMLSMRRLTGFLTGLAVLYVIWRIVAAIRRGRPGSRRRGPGSCGRLEFWRRRWRSCSALWSSAWSGTDRCCRWRELTPMMPWWIFTVTPIGLTTFATPGCAASTSRPTGGGMRAPGSMPRS